MSSRASTSDQINGLPFKIDFLATHPLPTWIVDAGSFDIRYANKAALDTYGFSHDEIAGKNFLELFTEDSRVEFVNRATLNNRALDGIYRHLDQNDNYLTVELFSNLVELEGITLLQFSSLNITNKNRSQENLLEDGKIYKTFIENSTEGIYCQEFREPLPVDISFEDIVDQLKKNSVITVCNDALAKMYGYEHAEEMRGILSEQLLHFDDPENIEYVRNFYKNNFKVINAESHEKDRYGNSKYFQNNAIGIVENGMLKRIWGTQKDITHRKIAESKLKESEDRFREVADSAPVMIWMSDENNNIVYQNKKWTEFTGHDLKSGHHTGWMNLVHAEDVDQAKSSYDEAFKNRKQIVLLYRMLHKDGTYKWVHDVSVPRFLQSGIFVGYIGSLVDIEDQKQKEKQLLYQATILENVSDIIITTDLDFKVKGWNRVAEHFYGITEEQAQGKMIQDLVKFRYDYTSEAAAMEELMQKGIWRGEVSFTNELNETRHFLHTVKYVYDENHEKIGFLDVGRDITDRKSAEEKMLKSEQFYRTLIADSLDGILLLDEEGTITFASPTVKKILGFEIHETLGKNAFDFIHTEDLTWAFQSFKREVEENPDIKFIVVRIRKKNGEWLWCNVRGHNLLNIPPVNSIVIYFHDDTLRKQAREALKESEERFRSLIKHLQTGVFLSDKQGNIMMCNKALAQMLSIPEEVIIGKNVYDIMSNDMIDEKEQHIPLSNRPLTKTLKEKVTVKDCVVGVLHPITKERCWIIVNSNPILDREGEIKHVVCSVMDITQRRKIEQQILADQVSHQRQLTQATIDGQEKERREIGKELHDNIGQQLTTIKLFLDMAKASKDNDEMMSLAVKGVSDVINEIRSMSRSLLPHTLKDLGLVDSVTELIENISRTQLMNVKFIHSGFDETTVPENQKLTLFRIVQEQLNNIVKHSKALNIELVLKNKNHELSLEIKDDGKGLDPALIRKGLGFTNIQNRVELFGGRSEIISTPGRGCTLKVHIPQATEKGKLPNEIL